ncbi:non-ribosomal peptide synthetase [Nonomuraea sp. CA-143628]|uniref:non-ribosomal peptide synthetase n=1 Tax=Nonomuraea sp. CA-143628 TaxID=3239997 RepID=UPI003D94C795
MTYLPQLLETAAAARPDAPAITGPTGVVSYGELIGRARGFAGLLRALGAAPGEVVAVEDGGTPASVIALAGTLYAGCVILPIDPVLSPELRDSMTSVARFLVRADDLFEPGQTRPMAVPEQVEPLAEPAKLDARSPAYLCFTSGSTGRPKAVLGAHDSLAHFVRWQRDTFEVGPGDRMAQLTSWSFDVVLRDIFTPLISGATLCLPGSRSRDAGRVFSFARTYGITLVHTVPSLVRRWLATAAVDTAVPTLRAAFFAGEPLHAELVNDWRGRVAPGSRVVNLYGPTETTLAQCAFEVPDEPGTGPLPVGRPLPGCSVGVLRPGSWEPDDVGEVVLTTPYRSLGYLGTDSTFETAPTGEQVYRTGDLGRWDERGSLHLLGRLDQQVKVRGVRLRLPEIERVLRGVAGVREAAVVVAGDARLVACLVGDPAVPPVRVLREAVLRELPAAAVPDEFVVRTDLPLLPNGKIDRTDLRAPAPVEVEVDAETGGNALVVETCRRVLGVESVPFTADLFELGVDSMSAMEIAARLEDELEAEIPYGLVFDHPTVEEISRYLADRSLG